MNEKLQEIKNAIGAKSLIDILQILNNKNENHSIEEDVQELILSCFLQEDIDRLFKEFVDGEILLSLDEDFIVDEVK